jgi:Zn/Cd-binding protein ZinT
MSKEFPIMPCLIQYHKFAPKKTKDFNTVWGEDIQNNALTIGC